MSDPTLDAPDASGPARADEAPPLPPRRSASGTVASPAW